MRWLVLDEIILIEKGLKAQTRSRIPAQKYSAEVLMIEMMAQTGALLVGAENDFQHDLIFAKIQEAKFEQNCRAGDVIEIEARSENIRPEGAWLDAFIQNGSGKIAEGRLLLTNVGRLVQGMKNSITFHDAFMNYFKVREKLKLSV